jgi:hypothetical protein
MKPLTKKEREKLRRQKLAAVLRNNVPSATGDTKAEKETAHDPSSQPAPFPTVESGNKATKPPQDASNSHTKTKLPTTGSVDSTNGTMDTPTATSTPTRSSVPTTTTTSKPKRKRKRSRNAAKRKLQTTAESTPL